VRIRSIVGNSANLLAAVISPLADRLARVLFASVVTAGFGDPETEYAQLLVSFDHDDTALEEAASELEEQGLVEVLRSANGGHPPFDAVRPEPGLAATYDPTFTGNDPYTDACQVAKDLASGVISDSVVSAALHYGWGPRRMNPAVTVLLSLEVIEFDDLAGSAPWLQHSMLATRKLRRFVEQLS
jgi:hypothetical protein